MDGIAKVAVQAMERPAGESAAGGFTGDACAAAMAMV